MAGMYATGMYDTGMYDTGVHGQRAWPACMTSMHGRRVLPVFMTGMYATGMYATGMHDQRVCYRHAFYRPGMPRHACYRPCMLPACMAGMHNVRVCRACMAGMYARRA